MVIYRTTVKKRADGGFDYQERVYNGEKSHTTKVQFSKDLTPINAELLVFPWTNDYDISIMKDIINDRIKEHPGYIMYHYHLPSNSVGCSVARKYVKEYLQRLAATKIASAWERAYWNPDYAVCRKRLLKTYHTYLTQQTPV